jgi:hypothetical protein
MESAPILVRLWDYGCLCRDFVKLAQASSDIALIEQYVASSAFHTSFLPNEKGETGKEEAGIHGPFLATVLRPTHETVHRSSRHDAAHNISGCPRMRLASGPAPCGTLPHHWRVFLNGEHSPNSARVQPPEEGRNPPP